MAFSIDSGGSWLGNIMIALAVGAAAIMLFFFVTTVRTTRNEVKEEEHDAAEAEGREPRL